jgi:hypothetical protein
MKRVVNTLSGVVPDLTPGEALKLLRTKHLGEDGILPMHEAKQVLYQAFPDCIALQDDGRRTVRYRLLLEAVLAEFVPAFQEGGSQGRPVARKSGLVDKVDELMKSSEARSLKHALGLIESRRLFPDLMDVRSAYYREKKKLR